jgi:hypothetical protein
MVKLLAEDASIFLASVDVACSAHLLPGTGSTSTPNLKLVLHDSATGRMLGTLQSRVLCMPAALP